MIVVGHHHSREYRPAQYRNSNVDDYDDNFYFGYEPRRVRRRSRAHFIPQSATELRRCNFVPLIIVVIAR
ncbi:hypothetical protein M0804_015046 [Polistes exclamans]|nr:hypothetical protein M0804_015047 [Polistes exclamans]KAI4474027.1 hypothetical protein M0804_015046 [Polistes exclamans]